MAYESQTGIWTLTAPDGRQWTGASGLQAAAEEQRERIPVTVRAARVFDALSPTQDERDAARYRWLRDVRFQQKRLAALVQGCDASSYTLDEAIDEEMAKTPNA